MSKIYKNFGEWLSDMESDSDFELQVDDHAFIALQIAFEEGYKAGAKWMKDQMVKKDLHDVD